jgi:predicted dinucleotide-binding enzyme
MLQEALPSAHVFKAFNTIGTPLMQQPDALGKPISMMFAGKDNGPARDQVAALIADVGFDPVYVGPIRYARNLEVGCAEDGAGTFGTICWCD